MREEGGERRGEDGQATCSSRIAKTSRTCQPPIFSSNVSSTRTSHKKESCCLHVQSHLPNFSIVLSLPRGEMPAMRNMKKMERALFSEQESGDVKYRQHEVHRTMLYLQSETTFPIPMTYVDVMVQTRTSIDNASERTLNDSLE